MPYLRTSIPTDAYIKMVEAAAAVGLNENEYIRALIDSAMVNPHIIKTDIIMAAIERKTRLAKAKKRSTYRGLWPAQEGIRND